MAFKLSNLLASAKADAAKLLLDGGLFRVYSGAAPTNVDDAETGTFLVEFALPSPAFGAVVNGVMSLLSVAPTTWAANGTAGYFRAYANTSPAAAACQGTVGTSGADAIITSTTAVLGGSVSLLSWVYTQPKA